MVIVEEGGQCSFKHHGSVCSTVPSEFIVTLDSTPASDDFTNDSGTLSSERNIQQVNATFNTAVSQPNSDENVPNQLVSSLENTEKPKVIFTLAGISSKATSELLQFTSKNTSSFNRCQERGVAAICPPNRSYVLDKFDFTHSGPSVADQQTNIKKSTQNKQTNKQENYDLINDSVQVAACKCGKTKTVEKRMYNNLKENSAKSYSYPDGILPFKIKDVKACTGRSCCVNLSCKSSNYLWIRVNSHELETDSCDSCGDSKADAYYFCKKCDNYYFCKTCFHSRRKLMSCT